MAIQVRVSGTRRLLDQTGTDMGMIFFLRVEPVPDSNQIGFECGYFFPAGYSKLSYVSSLSPAQ
jgi:hypothetical protein